MYTRKYIFYRLYIVHMQIDKTTDNRYTIFPLVEYIQLKKNSLFGAEKKNTREIQEEFLPRKNAISACCIFGLKNSRIMYQKIQICYFSIKPS